MADGKRGGARPNAGRKATGAKTRHYTVNLPIEEAELLEKHAAQRNMSVNKYLRELIILGGQYGNLESSADGKYVDEVVCEKSYERIENGNKVHVTETHIRRWVPEDDEYLMTADKEAPYVRNN